MSTKVMVRIVMALEGAVMGLIVTITAWALFG